jgi:hypothetical protein
MFHQRRQVVAELKVSEISLEAKFISNGYDCLLNTSRDGSMRSWNPITGTETAVLKGNFI